MKLNELKCKNCGTKLNVCDGDEITKCHHCKIEYSIVKNNSKYELIEENIFVDVEYDKKKGLFKYSKDRKFELNLVYCIICFLCLLLFNHIIGYFLSKIISNDYLVSIISNILLLIFLYLLYKKDLDREAKIFLKNFKITFKSNINYYLLGLGCMVFFNIIIIGLFGKISSNETQVREMLYLHPIYSLISISITAPICEEIIFRKSIQPLIKNKWLYATICGLLFGFAHILTNIINNQFIITDLVYILPYASLGFAFALMDYKGKSTFNSILVHMLHNTVTALLLLSVYSSGAL